MILWRWEKNSTVRLTSTRSWPQYVYLLYVHWANGTGSWAKFLHKSLAKFRSTLCCWFFSRQISSFIAYQNSHPDILCHVCDVLCPKRQLLSRPKDCSRKFSYDTPSTEVVTTHLCLNDSILTRSVMWLIRLAVTEHDFKFIINVFMIQS